MCSVIGKGLFPDTMVVQVCVFNRGVRECLEERGVGPAADTVAEQGLDTAKGKDGGKRVVEHAGRPCRRTRESAFVGAGAFFSACRIQKWSCPHFSLGRGGGVIWPDAA